jgi:hypothetical protein
VGNPDALLELFAHFCGTGGEASLTLAGSPVGGEGSIAFCGQPECIIEHNTTTNVQNVILKVGKRFQRVRRL